MERQMTYDLDKTLSSRNQGQLLSTQRVQTQAMRTPGLNPVRDTSKGGMGVPVPSGQLGAFEVELPIVGVINWRSLAFGAALGVIVWQLTKSRREAGAEQVGKKVAKAFA